jgi:LemA protein
MLQQNRLLAIGPSISRRGAVSRGCLAGLAIGGVVLILAMALGGILVGKYNELTRNRESVKGAWAEIDNQYKRRYELIPNLVETVKGAADFEKSTLEAVTQARASVGRVQLPNPPTDPAQMKAYLEAQQGLTAALTHLFAVAENYPQLKATQNFLSLQDQIEGTANRVTTARRDYIEAVRKYDTSIATFPGNLIAGMFHFERTAQLESTTDERANPKVDFGSGGQKK